jgi:hypothetical protein
MEIVTNEQGSVARARQERRGGRIIDNCRYRGEVPVLSSELLAAAWHNLFVEKPADRRRDH